MDSIKEILKDAVKAKDIGGEWYTVNYVSDSGVVYIVDDFGNEYALKGDDIKDHEFYKLEQIQWQ